MTPCINPERGAQLHAYELGWLDETEAEQFEHHLMGCRSCFDQLATFEPAAEYLARDPEGVSRIRHVLSRKDGKRWWGSRLLNNLWPDTPLIFRPALAYLAILVLLPLAFRGRVETDVPVVHRVQAVDLVSMRGARAPIAIPPRHELLLRFAFSGALPDRSYRVILSDLGGIVYRSDDFAFNRQRVGYLSIPARSVKSGSEMTSV